MKINFIKNKITYKLYLFSLLVDNSIAIIDRKNRSKLESVVFYVYV